MLTSKSGLMAANLIVGLFLSAVPASASQTEANLQNQTDLDGRDLPPPIEQAKQPVEAEKVSNIEGESDFSISANVAFTSEYRFRGVDLSGGEFAVQGGFDVSHSSGLYVGTWGSNIDDDTVGFGSTELDLYGGWSGDLTDGLSADVGVIYYFYPDAPVAAGDTDYVEFYGSMSAELGSASVIGGIAYAPDQDSLGGADNLYLYSDVSVSIPETPLTLNGHLGYTDGFLTFTGDSKAFDWSLGADLALDPVTLSVAYVGVEGDAANDPGGVFTDDAFVLTVSAEF